MDESEWEDLFSVRLICCQLYLYIFHLSTDALVESMKIEPFSLLIDGSNDTNLEKLNPLTVRIYDHSRWQVTTQLLDMCTTSGRNCGMASAIFAKVDSVLSTLNIPWQHCVGFGVDNASVNIGWHHSIKTEVQARNPACYFMGCPCHLLHNIASHALEVLYKVFKFDVEDMCIDISTGLTKVQSTRVSWTSFVSFATAIIGRLLGMSVSVGLA